jgi:hypothetical protein
MGEGWGEGEYNVISGTYVPLPFAPLLPPPTSGGGKEEESYCSPPTRGGEIRLFTNASTMPSYV